MIDTTKQIETSMWTLDEAIAVARIIEAHIIPAGYHCALGGGVLHKGTSDKDLDIFIYPHNGRSLNPALVRLKLQLAGCKLMHKHGLSANSKDTKVIELWEYKGKRIDFFFVA